MDKRKNVFEPGFYSQSWTVGSPEMKREWKPVMIATVEGRQYVIKLEHVRSLDKYQAGNVAIFIKDEDSIF